ncbi:ABC transporter permease [Eilatimonas milleporae]|uniref:Putative ABC transport system permease protein n=1 Tax=Eilatimonas milleporae TaxID=911205 RepID=A0A3M0CXR2_9PROT|nr:ABC transporter permease [Eilatimonas milleporae]RMB08713.1 putative ABC transport system permease protein [Eilatimonas milleporae]
MHLFATPLNKKLLRDLWRLRGPLTAVGLVLACGIMVFIMFAGMLRSLEVTGSAYYERTRFADIFAYAKRAPAALEDRLRRIAGVASVESRITGALVIDVPGFPEPVTGTLHSVPDLGRPGINDLVLRKGRWVDHRRADEVLVLEFFADAHGLDLDDEITATVNGKKQRLKIVGTVLSPEYIYAIAPGSIVPDNKRYGVFWMARRQLEAAYDMDGAFNSLIMTLRRDARAQDVVDQVDTVLDRYGGTGAYVRADHISDRFLTNEMDELRTQITILPSVFLGVAAFLLNIVIMRLVATEREIIGLLKAFGYSNRQVAGHYLALVMTVVVAAFVIGCSGGGYLGRGLANLYADYFHFPFLYFRAGLSGYVLAGGVAVLAGGLGAMSAIRAAVRLDPADAMRPPAPADYSGIAAMARSGSRFLDGPGRMVLRHILRHPRRMAMSVIGVALAMGLLTGASGNMDAINKMTFVTFEQSQLQDITVTLVDPRSRGVVYELARLPGVQTVEPFRSVPAILKAGTREKRQGLSGVVVSPDLNRLIDDDGMSVNPPEEGLMISRSLARTLGVGIGDMVRADITEGRRPTLDLRVTALVDAFVGTPAYMSVGTLNRLMDEGDAVSGAYLAIDPSRADDLFTELRAMPGVAGVELTQAAYRTFLDIMDENMGRAITINAAFSCLIIFGVVYNTARISLSERARELASMRVLGFHRAEVSFILLAELALVVLVALPLGAGFGALLSYAIVSSFSSDLFTIPFDLQPETIASSALIVVAAAGVSGLIVRRRIDRLDLIKVLKTRE